MNATEMKTAIESANCGNGRLPRVNAVTTTATAQKVTIEVVKVSQEFESGILVFGHRINNRRKGVRMSMVPRLYFVPILYPLIRITDALCSVLR